jgi:multimeric flavodoxin WrbA
MKVIGINGSPRKQWNTAKMVTAALQGAASAGAETKLYHLSEHDIKGCVSCFACLRLGGPSFGRCGYPDACKTILDDVLESDALILGSPVYFADVTAATRAFLERLWFGGLAYSKERMVLYDRRIPVKIILTTNAPTAGFHAALNEGLISTMERFVGPTEILEANDTLQFDDYSLYAADFFDVPAKQKRHAETFPQDLERAFTAGKNLFVR